MTVPTDTKYPAVATNAAWQKKKSFIDKAKASTKTGLGDKLTKAEAAWNAIPWAQLDAKKLNAKSLDAAEKNLVKGKAAHEKVTDAMAKLVAARLSANIQAGNKALSGPAKTAAQAIATALRTAQDSLEDVKLTDLEADVSKWAAAEAIKMTKVEISLKGKEVATAASGVWDRKVLKLAGVTWKAGKADDYKGLVVKVFGETAGNVHYEGIGKVFQNDMKLESSSGNTAIFRP